MLEIQPIINPELPKVISLSFVPFFT